MVRYSFPLLYINWKSTPYYPKPTDNIEDVYGCLVLFCEHHSLQMPQPEDVVFDSLLKINLELENKLNEKV